jgi:hypothetical protein
VDDEKAKEFASTVIGSIFILSIVIYYVRAATQPDFAENQAQCVRQFWRAATPISMPICNIVVRGTNEPDELGDLLYK